MKKKFLALVMTLSMVLSLVPMTALATEGDQVATVAAGSQSAGEDANGGSQDSNSNADSSSTTTSGEGSTGTSKDPDTNTGDKDESKDNESGSTVDPSKPEGGTGTGPTEQEKPEVPEYAAKIGDDKYPTVTDAIDAIKEGSSDNTITLLCDVTENITINKSLTLDLGGFTLTGTDEENAVVTITGAETTVTIMGKANAEEKTVNGTITGGKKGGIRITDADVTLNEVAVTENTTNDNGGGIYIKNGTLNISGGAVTKNKAAGKLESYTTDNGGGTIKGMYGGGGIYARNSSVTLNDVSISDNEQTDSPHHAGGILVYHGSLTMDGCTIKNNHARAVDGCGGGAYILHADSTISNSYIENNTADNGAGIYFYDAGNHAEDNCTGEHAHLITDSTISGNTASKIGGGMYIGTTSNLTLRNSKLLNNNGASQGGAIVAYSARTIELDGVSISENKAENGAGILANCTAACDTDIRLMNDTAIDKNTATGSFGGGIYVSASGNNRTTVSVADSSISGNTALNGAGIFTYALPDSTTQKITAEINVNLNSGATMHNNTATTGSGGAIYAYDKAAHINVAEGSALYNNTAGTAGDDFFLNGATFTLPKASKMSGDKQFKIFDEENGTVTGWFYDGWFKWDPNAPSASGEAETKGAYVEAARWSMDKADEYTPVENDTLSIALKAATKKAPSPGGSGGGHRPSNPPVTIPDDVPTGLNGKDHYAYVVGYPDGMVYPQKNITRAEVATIFFRLLKDETREANMTKSNGYNDMKDGAWYTCAVSTLSKMGIIKGYEDGSFKPDASISRAEFAAIAARFDPDGDTTPATFSDVSSHWAKDEISIAANHGWIKGYEDGSFKPDQKITRAETMTLVNRVLKRLPETKDDLHKDMKTWPDNQNESAWFYLAVQEATNSHYQNLKKDGTHEKWESMRETRDWAALEK